MPPANDWTGRLRYGWEQESSACIQDNVTSFSFTKRKHCCLLRSTTLGCTHRWCTHIVQTWLQTIRQTHNHKSSATCQWNWDVCCQGSSYELVPTALCGHTGNTQRRVKRNCKGLKTTITKKIQRLHTQLLWQGFASQSPVRLKCQGHYRSWDLWSVSLPRVLLTQIK